MRFKSDARILGSSVSILVKRSKKISKNERFDLLADHKVIIS